MIRAHLCPGASVVALAYVNTPRNFMMPTQSVRFPQ